MAKRRYIKKITIRQKLVMLLLITSVPTLALIAWLFFNQADKAFVNRTRNGLSAINNIKKQKIENLFEQHQRGTIQFSKHKFLTHSFKQFKGRHRKHGFDSEFYIDGLRLQENQLLNLKKGFGFDEFLLLNMDGYILFSDIRQNTTKIQKGVIGLNVNNEYFVGTGLSRAFIKGKNGYYISDFKASKLDEGQPVCYSAHYIGTKDKKIGVLIVKLKLNKFNHITTDTSGLGHTGQTYLVGSDMRMRSNTRSAGHLAVLNTVATHPPISDGFETGHGSYIGLDYKGEKVISVYEKLSGEASLPWIVVSEITTREALKDLHNIRNWVIFVTIGLSVIIIWLSLMVSKIISQPIVQVQHIVTEIATGKPPKQKLKARLNDDVGQMRRSINKLSEGFNKTSRFASEIGKGNFGYDYTPLSDKDTLGKALLSMRNDLQTIAGEEEKKNWVAAGAAKVNDIIRANLSNEESLFSTLAKEICSYTETQGCIIYRSTQQNNQIETIEAVGYYGATPPDAQALMEGMVHNCLNEQKTIYLLETEKSQTKILSGLGSSNPVAQLFVPLIDNNQLEGVIEIASFNELPPHYIDYVEQASEALASSLVALKTNSETVRLLAQSREKTEEFKAQEEEMRQNMEELEATREEMENRNTEFENLYNTLGQHHLVGFYYPDFTLKSNNTFFEQVLQNKFLAGKSHAEIFNINNDNNNISQQLKHNNFYYVRESVKNQTEGRASIFIEGFYFVTYNNSNKVSGYIYIGRHVTRLYEAEHEHQRLTSLIKRHQTELEALKTEIEYFFDQNPGIAQGLTVDDWLKLLKNKQPNN